MRDYEDFYGFKPYVSVGSRRALAARELANLKKKGRTVVPVVIEGRTIAKTFWGKAWCENLERYSDYANRLPRGRTYVRNGSVVDLRITPGAIHACVCGSNLYDVELKVAPVPANFLTQWQANHASFPLGIDLILAAGSRLAALPRSVGVTGDA